MAKQQKIVIPIPLGISARDREQLGFAIISYIQERSTEGLGKNGKVFPKYSKAYAERKGQNNVDLMDSGDMLVSLTLLTHRSGSITIGYPPGDSINDKVEGNRLGTYGQQSPIPGKARDFLALSQDELALIMADIDIDPNQAEFERNNNVDNFSSEAIDNLEASLRED